MTRPKFEPLSSIADRRSLLVLPVLKLILPSAAKAEDLVKIGGTGSSLAALGMIAEEYGRFDASFQSIVLPSLGSTGGIRALEAGVVGLAVSARPLTQSEISAGLRETAYARTPLVFVTHPAVEVRTVSLGDVSKIYSGELTSWPGGLPIRLIRRPPTEADWQVLSQLSPAMVGAVAIAIRRPGLVTAATDQDNVEAIETIRGAFGLAALGQILAEQRSLNRLSLEGLEPSLGALASGRWPMVRELRFVTRREPSPEVERFIAFVRGPQGAAMLESAGHLPIAAGR